MGKLLMKEGWWDLVNEVMILQDERYVLVLMKLKLPTGSKQPRVDRWLAKGHRKYGAVGWWVVVAQAPGGFSDFLRSVVMLCPVIGHCFKTHPHWIIL